MCIRFGVPFAQEKGKEKLALKGSLIKKNIDKKTHSKKTTCVNLTNNQLGYVDINLCSYMIDWSNWQM